MCVLQAYITHRISITVKPDPTAAVKVSVMDYDLVCPDEHAKQQLQTTLERVRPVVQGHKYATNLCDDLRETCYALCGRVRRNLTRFTDDHLAQKQWEMFGWEPQFTGQQ